MYATYAPSGCPGRSRLSPGACGSFKEQLRTESGLTMIDILTERDPRGRSESDPHRGVSKHKTRKIQVVLRRTASSGTKHARQGVCVHVKNEYRYKAVLEKDRRPGHPVDWGCKCQLSPALSGWLPYCLVDRSHFPT